MRHLLLATLLILAALLLMVVLGDVHDVRTRMGEVVQMAECASVRGVNPKLVEGCKVINY